MSAVWGVRVKLAAKGMSDMRLCSVQHRAWTTHWRVGSLPGVGLRRVTPPDFGVELCYVTINRGDLTPHQRWWYETADVHHRMKVRVQGWTRQPSTIVCLTRGPKAREWRDTVQHTLTRLTNQNSA